MTLYSFNLQYPKELPFRIVLSDGRTRTHPVSFTAEEIADAGYIAAPEKPTFNSSYQYLTWSGTDWVVGQYTIDYHKSRKKEELKDTRYNEEISHPTIDTSRQSQAMINGVWSAAQLDPNIIVNFKQKDGTWVQLNATAIFYVAQQVVAHVQACFNREKELSDLIDAATTHDEILAVDLNSGWPQYAD
jgi:hypothetical protein